MSSVPQKPPPSPEIARRVQFHTTQAFGIVLLSILPLLAIAGVFGTTRDLERDSMDSLSLSVDYVTRFRYKTLDMIEIEVENQSQEVAAGVEVRIDTPYIERFSNVKSTPQIEEIDGRAHIIRLGDLESGAKRTVSLEAQAEKYGTAHGEVSVRTSNGAGPRVTLSTVIYP